MTSATPLVSIIMPCYNSAAFLERTLQSIIGQSYPHWELILVDDGSSDHTSDIATRFSEIDRRIGFYSRPEPYQRGGRGAKNYGFTLCRGTYVVFFDSDDYMLETYLADRVNTMLGNPNADAVFSDFGWKVPSNLIPQEEIGIIILKRDIDKVAESTHRTQSGPFNDLGRDWIIYPNGNNILRPPLSVLEYKVSRIILKALWKINSGSGYKKYPAYFRRQSLSLIKWYYNETYALAEKYRRDYPNINYIEVHLEELNTIEGFEEIVKTFNLQEYYSKERVAAIIGKPLNLKVEVN